MIFHTATHLTCTEPDQGITTGQFRHVTFISITCRFFVYSASIVTTNDHAIFHTILPVIFHLVTLFLDNTLFIRSAQ